MKYLTRMLALTRLLLLKRQWRQIKAWLDLLPTDEQSALSALVYGESLRASKHPMPQFYASESSEPYRPWGDAVDTAFERFLEDRPQHRMRGVATWLTVVFHETQRSPVAAVQKLHAEVAEEAIRYRQLHERILAIRQAA